MHFTNTHVFLHIIDTTILHKINIQISILFCMLAYITEVNLFPNYFLPSEFTSMYSLNFEVWDLYTSCSFIFHKELQY